MDARGITSEPHLTLSVLKDTFAICRMESATSLPAWVEKSPWFSITRTPEEMSLVCPQALVPAAVDCERDWKCMRVEGPLGFTLVGILASLVSPLAAANVTIFSISTYDTDFLFVKEKDLETAIQTLSHQGHWISRS